MHLLKEVLTHEVYPALGCTEPISCAYAAALASAQLNEEVIGVRLIVDRGTFKNGAAVTVPYSRNKKGNLIAAVLGAVLAKPDAKLQILASVTDETREKAEALINGGQCQESCFEESSNFRVEAEVFSKHHSAKCLLSEGHTHIERIEKDSQLIFQAETKDGEMGELAYRDKLKNKRLKDLLALAEQSDHKDLAFIKEGIEMNLAMAERGLKVSGTAIQLRFMKDQGYLADDLFFRTKNRVASAVDARMAGLNHPVMTSGGSGNQGVVAILTLYGMGKEMGVSEDVILKSIALAHLINSYIKCYVGELAVICGCAMAAGIAASAGVVYQQAGPDEKKITMAVNNVIGDLGGLICDGAKPGCALKTITSVDAALRSALMALSGFGLAEDEGVVGATFEESIKNLGKITLEGMFEVDPTVLKILKDKVSGRGTA